VATITKTVDGVSLTADKFAYVGDPGDISTWHLPVDTKDHCESALSMFAHTDLPAKAKAATAAKIAAEAKSAGLDITSFQKNHLHTDHAESPAPWIEIFRAGDYRAKGKGLVTRDDLERVVQNYDPSFHEAPVTVGHPQDNLPAFGWVDRLAVRGDLLLAKERQVDPQFNEMRQAGRYKKRSASFYTGADGKISGLRHVGYLGAMPPEVKGLQDVQFDDNGRKFIEVDFGEEEEQMEKSIADQVKEYFAGLLGVGTPKTFSEADVTALVTSAVNTAVTAAVEPLKAQLATQTASFAERSGKLAEAELKTKAQEAIARLKQKGKWVPAFSKMGAELLFAELAGLSNTVEFGEGDAKKTLSPLQVLENFMEGLPAVVPTGTRFTPQAADHATTVDYGEKANPNSVQLHALASKRASEKSISYGEALTQVAQENPVLTKPGNASAGAV
jgi:hypothetical protein